MEENNHLEQLTAVMRTLSDGEARQLAYEVAREVNLSMHQGHDAFYPHPETWPAGLSTALERLPAIPSSVAIPWQAYSLSRLDTEYENSTPISRVVSILATIPAAYGMTMPPPVDIIGPYAGSLLDHLAELLSDAKELFIVNPYWSVQGTQELSRRLLSSSRALGSATVMTRAKLEAEHRHGLGDFLRLLQNRGHSISYWTPKPLPTNDHPLMHAKVVIADRKRAYLGSANLTDSGLNHSIELGVALEGAIVDRLQNWLEDLLCNFQKVDFVL